MDARGSGGDDSTGLAIERDQLRAQLVDWWAASGRAQTLVLVDAASRQPRFGHSGTSICFSGASDRVGPGSRPIPA
jgi:hypothetical protein